MSGSNNWYVITGAPSSGKSTLVKGLEKRGYLVVEEAARSVIDEELAEGKTIEEIRENHGEFQHRVLLRAIETEKKLPKDKIVFLDRSIGDGLAYNKLHSVGRSELLEKALKECSYKEVFLLEQLPYVKDYARIEPQEHLNKLEFLLEEGYKELGFEVTRVPAFKERSKEESVKRRINFILEKIKEIKRETKEI